MPECTEDLVDAWAFVATSAPGDEPTRAIETRVAAAPLMVAMDDDGVRHLLIPVSRPGEVVTDRRSRGVVVVTQDLVMDGEGRWFADLVVESIRYDADLVAAGEPLLAPEGASVFRQLAGS